MKIVKGLGLFLVVVAMVVAMFGFVPQRAHAQEVCWGGLHWETHYGITGWWIYGQYCSPGPDMVELPEGSVVGTFTQSTELSYAPEAGAGTGKVMDVGKTLWVVGMDSTHSWYKVVLSGVYLWVPVSSMSPNYDILWEGAPLPTTLAE